MGFKKIVIFAVLFGLISCSNKPVFAPVEEKSSAVNPHAKQHVVKSGETLYSIAWLYGVDYRVIADTNKLGSSYRIYPGQKLQLRGSGSRAKNKLAAVAKKPAKTIAVPKPIPRSSKANKPKLVRPLDTKSDKKAKAAPIAKRGSAHWQWPLRGKLQQKFSLTAPVNKGIDIKGDLGESVNASRDGVVVYAGAGLVGYGKLIIIKHDEHFLSAYGHNESVFVAEGQTVSSGQRIAALGGNYNNQSFLHFEIRRDGQPVNPLKYLK